MNLLPLRTKGDYLCIDTTLFNAINKAGLHYTWDYTNKGLIFDDNNEYNKVIQLQKECNEDVMEVISNTPSVIINLPKTKTTKKGRLF